MLTPGGAGPDRRTATPWLRHLSHWGPIAILSGSAGWLALSASRSEDADATLCRLLRGRDWDGRGAAAGARRGAERERQTDAARRIRGARVGGG